MSLPGLKTARVGFSATAISTRVAGPSTAIG